MAKVALIQKLFRVLNHTTGENLHGLEAQIFENFYESLEDAYNHTVKAARTLDEYREKGYDTPEVVVCAPLPEEGNPAPGLEELRRIQEAFPGAPIIVWSTRSEQSLRTTCLDDLGCAAYYTGTLLDAPDELPQIIADALSG